MNTNQQLALFPLSKIMAGETFPIAATPPETLNGRTSLTAALSAFHAHMRNQGFSENTIKAFGGDLNIFRKYAGVARPIAEISAQEITQFMHYLRFERAAPCNMKSYQRRLTSLKVFFNYLYENKAINQDPAAAIPHQPVITPLPEILHDDQVERLLAATSKLKEAKSDARPHLLVTLILATGIKKSECMALKLNDLDLSYPDQPYVLVRYADPRRRHKERKLRIPAELGETYRLYLEQYHPREKIFECTSRNLEYILTDLAEASGLNGKVSFEVLRWTSAVRDLQNGMREETLRQKLGLSTITWQEAGDKIKRLAAKPL
ncbi:MAG: tyrosine-type recombinase/integrase [Anaerolineae bacterium]